MKSGIQGNMKLVYVKLTGQQKDNLLAFMSRLNDIKGNETVAHVELQVAISRAIPEDKVTIKEEVKKDENKSTASDIKQ